MVDNELNPKVRIANAKTALDKAKQARKGKRYVILATIERPTVFYEVEESKFNANPKRYAAFRVVERGIW